MVELLQKTYFRALVLFTLIMLACLFATHGRICNPKANQKERGPNKHSAYEIECEGPLGVGPEGWTAIFTGGLFAFTVILAVATVRLFVITKNGIAEQATLTRESLEKAERSVQAAERALEGADTPYLDVVSIELNDGIIVETDTGIVSTRVATFNILNCGRSPSRLFEVYQGHVISNECPQPVAFPPPQTNLKRQNTIGPGNISEQITFEAVGEAVLQYKKWSAGELPNDTIWLIIQMRYADVFGNQFLAGFNFVYNSASGTFYALGGPEHNYRRKLVGTDLTIANERDGYAPS